MKLKQIEAILKAEKNDNRFRNALLSMARKRCSILPRIQFAKTDARQHLYYV